ncbi:hypothetical protein ACHAWO_003951 [Cyclotella atomus]|uniref:Transmembrane protein n=1 Tax=Cyclotella atomus TaxID=382360 RepID=A0ABD3NML9_9STRA
MSYHVIYITLLALLSSTISPVYSQQRFEIAVGNRNGGDVIKREYYEYTPPGERQNRRQASPFGGFVPGIFIVVASSALQWYNEGRAVRDAKLLAKAEREVAELDPSAPFDELNDGKLVHITGDITTNQGLTDPVHGLHRPDALQLIRETEAYEWNERKSESRRRVSETETKVEVFYRYNKQWSNRHIDSSRFQSPSNHYNPQPRLSVGRSAMTVSDAKICNGLRIPPDLINQISSNDVWNGGVITTSNNQFVSPVSLERGAGLAGNDNAVVLANENKLYFSERKSQSELLASGSSQPGTGVSNIPIVRSLPYPEVGDVKVSWKEIKAPRDGVSILAKQEAGSLVPWSHNNDGHYVYTLLPGNHSARSMISHLIDKSKTLTKILRIGGWIGNFIGLNIFLSCIPALVKLLPFGIGSLLEPLVSLATSTIALGASIGLSFSVIALAWLRFRPLFAVFLGVVSGAGFIGPYYYARSKRSSEVFEMDNALNVDAL